MQREPVIVLVVVALLLTFFLIIQNDADAPIDDVLPPLTPPKANCRLLLIVGVEGSGHHLFAIRHTKEPMLARLRGFRAISAQLNDQIAQHARSRRSLSALKLWPLDEQLLERKLLAELAEDSTLVVSKSFPFDGSQLMPDFFFFVDVCRRHNVDMRVLVLWRPLLDSHYSWYNRFHARTDDIVAHAHTTRSCWESIALRLSLIDPAAWRCLPFEEYVAAPDAFNAQLADFLDADPEELSSVAAATLATPATPHDYRAQIAERFGSNVLDALTYILDEHPTWSWLFSHKNYMRPSKTASAWRLLSDAKNDRK